MQHDMIQVEYHQSQGYSTRAHLIVWIYHPSTQHLTEALLPQGSSRHDSSMSCPPALLEQFAAANREFTRSTYLLNSESEPVTIGNDSSGGFRTAI
jgi:hypothetical protein